MSDDTTGLPSDVDRIARERDAWRRWCLERDVMLACICDALDLPRRLDTVRDDPPLTLHATLNGEHRTAAVGFDSDVAKALYLLGAEPMPAGARFRPRTWRLRRWLHRVLPGGSPRAPRGVALMGHHHDARNYQDPDDLIFEDDNGTTPSGRLRLIANELEALIRGRWIVDIREAADELDRLRAENQRLRDAISAQLREVAAAFHENGTVPASALVELWAEVYPDLWALLDDEIDRLRAERETQKTGDHE